MDNYYHAFINDIKVLMEAGNYKDAVTKLEEEFSMPYIPKEYEEQMIALYNECRHEIQGKQETRKYSEEDIDILLKGSIDEACQAVEILKGSNIRRHLETIESYLKKEPHFLIRTLLVEALVEQDIKDEIQMDYDGLEVCFTPTFVELPSQQEELKKAVEIVRSFFENDNPSFLIMCVESMMKEMYFKLPFSLGEDEVDPFLYAILSYVYKANGDEEGFEAFIHEKNLANSSGYDLLLYKYDI